MQKPSHKNIPFSTMEDPTTREEEDYTNSNTPQVLQVLRALKQASHDLQHKKHRRHDSDNNSDTYSLAIKALLELHTESDTILSNDPNLSALSNHLTRLKHLVDDNNGNIHHHHHSLRSFLTRRASTRSISKLANSIESEIQAWIDRESVHTLTGSLNSPNNNTNELITLLTQFQDRVNQGFNRELQDLILKNKIFSSLESVLFDAKCSQKVREQAGSAVASLIKFNKDVFVGQVLMGPTIGALVGLGSLRSIEALCSLIRLIKSPFVDEIESNGEIGKIIGFLDSKDLGIRVLGMECVLEIGYFGRKEAVEAMLKEGLVEKLVEMQRSELGGDLIDLDHHHKKKVEKEEEEEEEGEEEEKRGERFLEGHPFASCVARFAVQLEVGEGLRQREKRAFRQDILVRVREASVSDAEAATIVAEVLWGTSL